MSRTNLKGWSKNKTKTKKSEVFVQKKMFFFLKKRGKTPSRANGWPCLNSTLRTTGLKPTFVKLVQPH